MNKVTKEEIEKEFMEVYEIYDKSDLEFFKLNGNNIIAFTEYIVNMKRYEDE